MAKLRPDDHWYGPMLPWCALDLSTTGYFSMQAANERSQGQGVDGPPNSERASVRRWSDQFFILPRPAAGLVMRLIDDMSSDGQIYCNSG